MAKYRVDLLSDTITLPTPAMRDAMAHAELGDDVFGEDPTINRLEALAASMLGKEAGLFVASGTMGNLVSLLAHCGRGDEVILGDQAHCYIYEQGGLAALGGINPRVVRNLEDGTLDLAEVEAAIRTDNVHFPRTRLITVENTQNRRGGVPLTVEYMRALGKLARSHSLRIHLDGARLFNAAAALGVEARELVADCDSATFCLSKALGAPVGSVVVGSHEFISDARRARKVVGGGMRQAGVLAAAGIVALEQMVDRLVDDHARAAELADGLAGVQGIEVEPLPCRTNMVFFRVTAPELDARQLAERVAARDVRIYAVAPRRIRLVTNYHITPESVQLAVAAIRRSLVA